MAKIAIDNGHGLKTAGKRTPPFPNTGQVIHEWQFNHATAKKLEQILRSQGHQVLMVSDTQDDTPLSTRSTRANNWGADVFVSVHYNAYQSVWGTHGGLETLFSQGSTNGQKLAKLVQDELIKATGLRDRGTKPRSDLSVLNNTKMVAILPECGFMDNLQEASLMLNEGYQMKCAQAIANGINQYLGINKTITPQEPVVIPPNTPTVPQTPSIDSPSGWAKLDWDWGKLNGLVDGTNPKGSLTREQLVAVLHRFYNKLKANELK